MASDIFTMSDNESSPENDWVLSVQTFFYAMSAFDIVTITVGFLFNVTGALVILRNPSLWISVNIYIANLMIADTVFLIGGLLSVVYMLATKNLVWWDADIVLCFFRNLLSYTAFYAALGTIGCIAMERFLAICRPCKLFPPSNVKRAIICSILTWISGTLFTVVHITECWYSHNAKVKTAGVSQIFIFGMVVSLTIAGLYSAIACYLHNHKRVMMTWVRNRRVSVINQPGEGIDVKKVVLVFCVTGVVHLICGLPRMVHAYLELWDSLGYRYYDPATSYIVETIGNSLLIINSLANPLTYNSLNAPFKVALIRMLGINQKVHPVVQENARDSRIPSIQVRKSSEVHSQTLTSNRLSGTTKSTNITQIEEIVSVDDSISELKSPTSCSSA